MEVQIREAVPADAEALAKLVSDFWTENNLMVGVAQKPSGDGNRDDKRLEIVSQELQRDDTGYIVAVSPDGRELLGFRKWRLQEEFYFTKALYVVPEWRRKGIARRLVSYFEDWVREKGQSVAVISIVPHNDAMINLVRSEGYDILNTIEVRKNLVDSERESRGEVDALGVLWRIM